jgi:hypothetical protein
MNNVSAAAVIARVESLLSERPAKPSAEAQARRR